jgi:ribosome maturation factor RimP
LEKRINVTTPLEHQLTAFLTPLLAAEGFDLVQLSMLGEGRGTVLQILIEDPKTLTADLDSCARLSRTLGTHLEVEDVIRSPYRLEISSPGIDRPLTKPEHFKRYLNFEARIETDMAINDQRRFHGRLRAADDTSVTIETETKTVTLDYTQIARARLKLTDELIKASRPANLNTDTLLTDTPHDQTGEAKK